MRSLLAPSSTSRRSPRRPWTAMHSVPRKPPGRFRWSSGSPPARLRRARSRPAARWRSPRAARFPMAQTRLSPSSTSRRRTARSPSLPPCRPAPTSGRVEATSPGEARSSPAGARIGPAQIGALGAAGRGRGVMRPPSTRRSRHHGLRASRARLDAGAGRDLRVERRHARGAAVSSRGGGAPGPLGGGRRGVRTGRQSSRASSSTCSSRRAVSPSGRTTSCGASRRSSESRRCSGEWPSSLASLSRSAFVGTRSSSACPAIPSRRSWPVRCSCSRR